MSPAPTLAHGHAEFVVDGVELARVVDDEVRELAVVPKLRKFARHTRSHTTREVVTQSPKVICAKVTQARFRHTREKKGAGKRHVVELSLEGGVVVVFVVERQRFLRVLSFPSSFLFFFGETGSGFFCVFRCELSLSLHARLFFEAHTSVSLSLSLSLL